MTNEISSIKKQVFQLSELYESQQPSHVVSGLFSSVAVDLAHVSDNITYLTNPTNVSKITPADILSYNENTQLLLVNIQKSLSSIEKELKVRQ